MTSPHLLFFRGLNTYGHDHAQLSILKLGPMFKHMQRELVSRGVDFHPVLNMGVGPLDEVSDRAVASVEALPVWTLDQPVHLVGHSAGGLVARRVLDRLGHMRLSTGEPKIASLMTIASPHRGSGLAQIFVDMPDRYPGSTAVFRAIGYDIRPKLAVFRTMTAAHVAESMAGVDADRFPEVRTASIVCAPPKRRWSRVMRTFHLLRAFRAFDQPSDGIIEKPSQVFGREVHEVELDHFQQAGFFGGRAEFARMCDVVAEFAKRASPPS
jgi:triacylglycerol lipase